MKNLSSEKMISIKIKSFIFILTIALAAMALVAISIYFMETDAILEHGNSIAKSALLVPIGLVSKMFYTHDKDFYFPSVKEDWHKILSIFALIVLSIAYLVAWENVSKYIKDIDKFNISCTKLINNRQITLERRSEIRSSLVVLYTSIEKTPTVFKNKFLQFTPKECGL